MELTFAQKQSMYEQGFVKLSDIVQNELIEDALRAIYTSLGLKGMDPAKLDILRSQTYCPELCDTPAITELVTESPIWSLAESAIGVDAIQPVQRGQIALRFPTLGPVREPGPHIDGTYSPTNGVPKGEIRNFTMLVGVFLSDIPHEYMGNLSVWPGSHRLYESYFRQHNPQMLLDGLPLIDLPEPVQITAQPGDAVLCHYQLAHGIAGNASPFIRNAIFFRLKHKNHAAWTWECMTDIWKEWGGMQDVVGGATRI